MEFDEDKQWFWALLMIIVAVTASLFGVPFTIIANVMIVVGAFLLGILYTIWRIES